ncbi:MAG: type IV pili methyl-accepting chemotaxis transducer N-terminal domain-containing protein [Pseudomonadota bacterium]
MTTALVHVNGLKTALPLAADLAAAGFEVLATVQDRAKLMQEVVRHAPDVLICDAPAPDEALFKATAAIAEMAPCAVIVFTADADVGHMDRALASGVHGYEVNGYAAPRLRALVHLAQARFRQAQAHAQALADISTRFEERKLVERAKGILMQTQQLSDDDAFHILRTASMHTNQRLGQVSQHIVQSARFAEDVNRCGQLRMLSQRLVTLQVLQGVVGAGPFAQQLAESVQRIDANLAYLGKSLSQATYGDLLGQVLQTWGQLQPMLRTGPGAEATVAAYARLDELAEHLLQGAERLTGQLESASPAPPLRVLNLAGRQRMLSQRFAKYAVLALLGDAPLHARSATGMAESRAAFEAALTYLNSLPLSTPDIHTALESAGVGWLTLLAATKAAPGAGEAAQLNGLAGASESLLAVLEQLSAHYEHSMQMLTGA